MTTLMIRAVGYIRVSGKGQLDGDGFDRQRDYIERYAAANGYTIADWFEERAVCGATEWEDRPAWTEMIATTPQVIIVERLERLARDMGVQEYILRNLKKRGVTLLSTAESDLENPDPARVLFRQMMGCIAQYDRAMIESKLRAARSRIRAREGRCEGRKPFGGHPKFPQEAVQLVRLLQLSRQGFTTREIASQLNADQVPTRTGGPWHHATVARIVSAQRPSCVITRDG